MAGLRTMLDGIRKTLKEGVVVLGGVKDGKVALAGQFRSGSYPARRARGQFAEGTRAQGRRQGRRQSRDSAGRRDGRGPAPRGAGGGAGAAGEDAGA